MARESYRKVLERIPGTQEHGERKAAKLFSEAEFSHDDLTGHEAGVLAESVEAKYVPALVTSFRARIKGLIVGVVAPYEFLLIGAVTLAASAAGTTGAWYSITLKEMKAKFENMGLSLTSKLLDSDMLANSFSIYAGVGFAYKSIAFPSLKKFISDPTKENFLEFAVAVAVTGIIHGTLEGILSKKEAASIQFDFNDATLAGMTEEQQKFFSKAVSEVEGAQSGFQVGETGTATNRRIFKCATTLSALVQKFDVSGAHAAVFGEVGKELGELEDNYEADTKPFIELFVSVVEKVVSILILEEATSKRISGKVKLLKELAEGDDDDTPQKVVAIITDTIPEVIKFMEQKGEKGIKAANEAPVPAAVA